jgi:hypothetical protein
MKTLHLIGWEQRGEANDDGKSEPPRTFSSVYEGTVRKYQINFDVDDDMTAGFSCSENKV